MTVRIELCGVDAADELMWFFRTHWKADHVLGLDRGLLDWQHRAPDDDERYDVLVARDGDTIVGMLGFIRTSRYDPSLAEGHDTFWLTTWKVLDEYRHGLGLRMLRHLERRFSPAWIGTVGLNPETLGIYRTFGYRTGRLDRFFLVNPQLEQFTLAQVPDRSALAPPAMGDATIQPTSAAAFWDDTAGLGIDDVVTAPRKTRRYIETRYLQHPFYDYTALVARDRERGAILVARTCEHDGATALRIVDVVGDPQVLAASGAEYLDVYCTDAGDQLRAAGLHDAADHDDVVLPGYFEPFERSNVDLLYALHGPGDSVMICKGDADQDRPNRPQQVAA